MIRRINCRWPWLKIVGLCGVVLLMVVMILRGGWFEIEQNNGEGQESGQAVKMFLEGREQEVEGVDKVVEEVNKKIEQEKRLEGKKLVALTFDDGPEAGATPAILEILREKEVKATFFMVGIMIQRAPEVAKQVAAAGHEVESHSMGHKNLTEMTEKGAVTDMAEAKRVLGEITGVEAKILRPPYGAVNETVRMAAKKERLTLLGWSVDPDDWQEQEAEVVWRRVVEATYDGAVVLLHDIYRWTGEAIGGIIDDLRGQGYEFVTVEELAKYNGVELSTEVMYRDLSKD